MVIVPMLVLYTKYTRFRLDMDTLVNEFNKIERKVSLYYVVADESVVNSDQKYID